MGNPPAAPTPIVLASATRAGRICRIIAGLEQTLEQKQKEREDAHVLALAKAKAASGAPPLPVAPERDTVDLSTVISQTMSVTAPLLSNTDIQQAYAEYEKVYEGEPPERHECSHEQLTGFKWLLDLGHVI